MSLIASGVGLPPDLASTLSSFGGNAYNQIGANYGKAKQQVANDASVRGLPPPDPNSYPLQRLNTQEGLDTGNLEASLGSGLGNTAYNNALQQRDFGQQEQLTDLIGNAMRPSTLQQIFQGIGGGTRAAGQVLPFLGMMGGGGGSSGGLSTAQVPPSGYDPSLGYYYE